MVGVFILKIAILATISLPSLTHEKASSIKNVNQKLDVLIEEMESLKSNFTTENNASTCLNVSQMSGWIERVLNKMNDISFQLIDQRDETTTKDDVIVEMTSENNSIGSEEAEPTSDDVTGKLQSPLQQENENSVNLCDSNPCLYGGRCRMTTQNDYECVECHRLTSGKNCQNLNCGYNSCFATNDTLYLVVESKYDWEQANRKCLSEGMTLVMPKDKESHEFIRSQLRSIYGTTTSIHFWMGLRRDASGWRWVDGSALGSYTGGRPNLNNVYGLLSSLNTMWADVHIINHSYYPICEKRPLLN